MNPTSERNSRNGIRVKALTTTRQGGVSQGPYASLNLADHVGDAADYVQRNRLTIPDRGLAVYNGPINGGWPLGNSSFGNPGTFYPLDASGTRGAPILDPECGREIGPAATAT